MSEYIPDPIELGEERAERAYFEHSMGNGDMKCYRCGTVFKEEEGHTLTADPYAPLACPSCVSQAQLSMPIENTAAPAAPKEIFRIALLPNGTSKGVYHDESVLKGEVRRASNVEFNNDTKVWEAHLNDGTLIASDVSRQACIQKEIDYLNDLLRHGGEVPHAIADPLPQS